MAAKRPRTPARPPRAPRLLERLESRLMYNAVPVVALDVPPDAAVNSTVSFQVSLDNASTVASEVGYAPFVDIEAARGLYVAGATHNGQFIAATLVGEFNAQGQLVIPILNLPRTHPLTGQAVTGTPGARLYTLDLPQTSLAPDDPSAALVVHALVSRADGATGTGPLAIRARGGFALGADPAANPDVDPPLVGASVGDSLAVTGTATSATLNVAQAQAASFNLVWLRLTPAETLTILADHNYLRGLPSEVPNHLRAAGVLDWLWFDQPFYAGQLRYNPVTETFSGSLLTHEPWDVAATLEAAFLADRTGFLGRYFTAERANELTNQQSVTDPNAGPALTRGISWLNTQENLDNLVHTANIAYRHDRQELNRTPTRLKTATDAQPAGDRIVRSMGFEYLPQWSNGTVKLAYYDNEVQAGDYVRPSIWTDQWRQQIEPIWDAYWSEYQALGGQIDWLVFDMERTPLLYDGSFDDPAYLQQVVNDPRFATLAQHLGWQNDPLGNFQAALGNYERDPRAWMFHEYLHKLRADDLNFLVDIVQRYFPEAKALDYNHATKAPGTFTAGGAGKYYLTPIGTGSVVGTHSSMPLYGELRDAWLWGPQGGGHVAPMGPAGPNYPLPPDVQTNWNAFTYNLMRLRSSTAASTTPVATWLSYKDFNDPAVSQLYASEPQSNLLFNSDLWYELIFHAELSGAEIVYWNRNGTFNDLPMSQAIAEVDQVVKHTGLRVMPPEHVEWNQPFLATRADVGGRIVWRVTPDPTRPFTITPGETLTFDFGAAGRLEIPRGQIVPLANGVSTAGFWIYQANSVAEMQFWTQNSGQVGPGTPVLTNPGGDPGVSNPGGVSPTPGVGGGTATGGSSNQPVTTPTNPVASSPRYEGSVGARFRFAWDSFQQAALSGQGAILRSWDAATPLTGTTPLAGTTPREPLATVPTGSALSSSVATSPASLAPQRTLGLDRLGGSAAFAPAPSAATASSGSATDTSASRWAVELAARRAAARVAELDAAATPRTTLGTLSLPASSASDLSDPVALRVERVLAEMVESTSAALAASELEPASVPLAGRRVAWRLEWSALDGTWQTVAEEPGEVPGAAEAAPDGSTGVSAGSTEPAAEPQFAEAVAKP